MWNISIFIRICKLEYCIFIVSMFYTLFFQVNTVTWVSLIIRSCPFTASCVASTWPWVSSGSSSAPSIGEICSEFSSGLEESYFLACWKRPCSMGSFRTSTRPVSLQLVLFCQLKSFHVPNEPSPGTYQRLLYYFHSFWIASSPYSPNYFYLHISVHKKIILIRFPHFVFTRKPEYFNISCLCSLS